MCCEGLVVRKTQQTIDVDSNGMAVYMDHSDWSLYSLVIIFVPGLYPAIILISSPTRWLRIPYPNTDSPPGTRYLQPNKPFKDSRFTQFPYRKTVRARGSQSPNGADIGVTEVITPPGFKIDIKNVRRIWLLFIPLVSAATTFTLLSAKAAVGLVIQTSALRFKHVLLSPNSITTYTPTPNDPDMQNPYSHQQLRPAWQRTCSGPMSPFGRGPHIPMMTSERGADGRREDTVGDPTTKTSRDEPHDCDQISLITDNSSPMGSGRHHFSPPLGLARTRGYKLDETVHVDMKRRRIVGREDVENADYGSESEFQTRNQTRNRYWDGCIILSDSLKFLSAVNYRLQRLMP
ncbi:hypothetical protein IWW34DRAFT_910979 [Fusarium oxysporum f. sp. albedinis]|nr:hypothetical protein IWW34DRAFT_910979 [Fusarium oxysporum f. sp. albedinis]